MHDDRNRRRIGPTDRPAQTGVNVREIMSNNTKLEASINKYYRRVVGIVQASYLN